MVFRNDTAGREVTALPVMYRRTIFCQTSHRTCSIRARHEGVYKCIIII